MLLIALAVAWAAFWSAGAAMTTETGIWNSATWALMAVAAFALLPLGTGIFLLVRAAQFWLAPHQPSGDASRSSQQGQQGQSGQLALALRQIKVLGTSGSSQITCQAKCMAAATAPKHTISHAVAMATPVCRSLIGITSSPDMVNDRERGRRRIDAVTG